MTEPADHRADRLLDDRWAAVLERRDAPFVYAVSSTRVYCRPSCSSRRPNRAHVRFYDVPADAVRAGFRACLRCRPDESVTPEGAGPAARDRVARVRAACTRIVDDPTTGARALTRAAGVSARQLERDFSAVLGVTRGQYAAAARATRFRRAVGAGVRVAEATFEAGFGSSSRLYERASPLIGMTPGRYARGGAALTIRHHVVETVHGRLLLAATEAGFCALRFGDADAVLLAELEAEFPRATLVADAQALAPWAELVTAYLSGRAQLVEIPLDVAATAFQLRVWSFLRSIPAGETRTYGEIAGGLGLPRAARAVGNACAANPVALAIPCHRAVGRGSVGGYRWGTARKRALLAGEARDGAVSIAS